MAVPGRTPRVQAASSTTRVPRRQGRRRSSRGAREQTTPSTRARNGARGGPDERPTRGDTATLPRTVHAASDMHGGAFLVGGRNVNSALGPGRGRRKAAQRVLTGAHCGAGEWAGEASRDADGASEDETSAQLGQGIGWRAARMPVRSLADGRATTRHGRLSRVRTGYGVIRAGRDCRGRGERLLHERVDRDEGAHRGRHRDHPRVRAAIQSRLRAAGPERLLDGGRLDPCG